MTWIAKHCLTPEGEAILDDLPSKICQVLDQRDAKVPIETSNEYCLEFLDDLISRTGNRARVPNLACFPKWKVEKESKMWLTDLDPPSQDRIESLRVRLRSFIGRKGPSKLYPGVPEAHVKTGFNLYNDMDKIRHDWERPSQYVGPLRYQRIHNQPLSYREIWLPSKAYKTMSSFWMALMTQILKKIEYCVCNETAYELTVKTGSRFKPCRTLDLKGAGLQFPREYINVLHEVVSEIYPDPVTSQATDAVRDLFKNLQLDDTTFVKPKRGTGLGYFEIEKAIIIACLLEDCDVVRMYNDDILVPEAQYAKAKQRLIDFSFVINEEKSGILWRTLTFFGGYQIVPGRRTVFGGHQREGYYSSIFTKRRHWTRKLMCSLAAPTHSRYIAMHLEILYGHEFRKGEYLSHPRNLGANRTCPPIRGWTDDYILSKNATPKGSVEDYLRYTLFFDKVSKEDENELHHRRKKLWKNRQVIDDTPYRWWEPDSVLPKNQIYTPFDKLKTGIPEWVENNLILWHEKTAGLKSRGLLPNELDNAILWNRYSLDPWRDQATGGSVVDGIHVWRAVPTELQFWNDLIKRAEPITRNFIQKIKLSESTGVDYYLKTFGETTEDYSLCVDIDTDEELVGPYRSDDEGYYPSESEYSFAGGDIDTISEGDDTEGADWF